MGVWGAGRGSKIPKGGGGVLSLNFCEARSQKSGCG